MNVVLGCPDCHELLWAMRCGPQLGGSDLIVCIACEFFEPVGAWVAEQVVALKLDGAVSLAS
jgi:hypothetical protein